MAGPGPDGEPRPPLRRDPAGRHGHRQREPDPRQRGVRQPDHRQPVQGRRERLLPHDQAGPRLGPRQPGRAEADARPDEAEVLHPDPRRVPDAGPARPPGDRDRASCPRTSSSSRTASRSRSTPTAPPAAASRCPRATSSSTACRSATSARSSCATGKSLANDGMFMVVVTIDKQTGNVVGRPEIITRGFVHQNEQDPMMDEAIERILDLDPEPGRPHQRDRAAEEPDQGRRVALPVRADEAPADGLPGRGRDLMATDAGRRRRPPRARAEPPRIGLSRRQPRGRPLDRRDRPARARRGHADRARAPGPGRADRLVARLDRAVVRDRPLAPAVPPARRRLVRRVGPGQAARTPAGALTLLGIGDRLRRLPRARSRSST